MQDNPEQITAAVNWLQSPAGRLAVAKLLLPELEAIEDFESCQKIQNTIIEIEKEIENES